MQHSRQTRHFTFLANPPKSHQNPSFPLRASRSVSNCSLQVSNPRKKTTPNQLAQTLFLTWTVDIESCRKEEKTKRGKEPKRGREIDSNTAAISVVVPLSLLLLDDLLTSYWHSICTCTYRVPLHCTPTGPYPCPCPGSLVVSLHSSVFSGQLGSSPAPTPPTFSSSWQRTPTPNSHSATALHHQHHHHCTRTEYCTIYPASPAQSTHARLRSAHAPHA